MSNTLTGNQIKNTYQALLKIGTNGSLNPTTATVISDGLGNDTPLYLSGQRVGIGNPNPNYKLDVLGQIAFKDSLGYDYGFLEATGGNIYFGSLGTQNINLYSGGTPLLFINGTTGNVGIGTNTPNSLLEINGSGVTKMIISSSYESQLRLNANYGQISNVTGDLYFTIESASGNQIFRTGSSTERMRITSAGNVVLNTTTPQANAVLTIKETASLPAAFAMINRNSTHYWGLAVDTNAVDDRNFGIYDITNGQFPFIITPTGNVGIGTQAPSSKLEVYGKIAINTTGNQSTTISNNLGTGTVGRNIFIGGGGNNLSSGTGSDGSYNTSIGYASMTNLINGYQNTSIGYTSLYSNIDGAENTAIGFVNMYSNSHGSYNTSLGSQTLFNNISGNYVTAIGYGVLFNNTANNNTGIGALSLNANITGINNTAIGNSSLRNNLNSSNTAIGFQSMVNNTNGAENVAIGVNTLYTQTTAYFNTSIGAFALSSNTTANHNTAIGHNALLNNATGTQNTAIGSQSLKFNNGSYNTAIGYSSLQNNTSAGYNTAIGYNSLLANTTGEYNVSIGNSSQQNSTIGTYNSSLGAFALVNNNGDRNVAIGCFSMSAIDGSYNTSIGMFSGNFSISGNNTASVNSTYLGYNTKSFSGNNQNEIVIGYNTESKGDNTATLGNDNIIQTYLKGQVSVAAPTINPAVQLQVDSPNNNTGFLCPRMERANILAISNPPEGLLIYCTDTNAFAFYDGAAWQQLNTYSLL